MKKLLLVTILLSTPATFCAKPSQGRTYHVTKGTLAGALTVLGGLGIGMQAYDGYDTIRKSEFTVDIFGKEVNNKPLVVTSYACGILAGLLGVWKLGSIMKSSFQKAFGSSELLEVTQSNYESAVMESDKPVVLVVLPEADELSSSACSTLTALHKELHNTITFGTLELEEATAILGIRTPSVLLIKHGNLVARHEGIYNEEQLSKLIKHLL
jgi:hypothetical protein